MSTRPHASTALVATALAVTALLALPTGAAVTTAPAGHGAVGGQQSPAAATAAADGAVTVRLVPADSTVAPNGTTTVDVVIEGATEGVYGFDLTVDVAADADVATIESAAAAGDPTFDRGSVAPDNGSVRLQVGGVALGGDGDPVTVASVTVGGDREGTAVLTVGDGGTVAAPPDPNVTAYPIASRVGATVEVAETPAPAVPGGEGPATNVDADPQLEDVDGDGEFTVFDVQTFLEAFDGPVVRANAAAFDFDGSGDGAVTIFDVQALLEEL